MYTVKYLGDAVQEVPDLPAAGMAALMALLAAMQLVPWNFADRDAGNMPTIAFGPNSEGLATILIWDDDLTLNVTKVQWAG